MIINAKVVLNDLAGQALKDSEGNMVTLGKALANIVISSEEGSKIKNYILATELFKGQNITVDDADLSSIKSAVKSTKIYNSLVAGQCEMLLEKIKEESSTTKKSK